MKKIILVLIISLVHPLCKAQPANDNCPGDMLNATLSCVPVGGTIASATYSGLPASCGGLPNHDVFYYFVATHTTHTVTVTGCPAMDPVIHVYSGSCGGTSINCFNVTGIGAPETGTLNGLTIGATYWLKVYDFYGNPSCSTFTICVAVPPPPTLVAAIAPTMVNCYGNCNGSAIAAHTGGYGPYSLLWTGPNAFTSTNDSIAGLCVGTYTLTVTDSFNMATATATTNITQTYPTFNIIASSDTAFCSGGTASLNVDFDAGTFSGNCGLSNTGACTGAASVATVGTGLVLNNSFSFPAPFANWYTSNVQQYLYTVADLNTAGIFGGKIDELAWNVTNIPTGCIPTFHEYTVKMGCTNLSAFSNSPAYIPGLTTVFPAQPVTIAVGWNTLVFPLGYYWDGVSNLLVELCSSEGPPFPNYTSNAISAYSTTSFISSQWWISDQQDQCPAPTGFGSAAAMRPNMRLHYCSATYNTSDFSYSWAPSIGNIANDTLQYTTGQPSATTSYVVTVTDVTSGCYKQDTVNVTISNPVANFTMVPDSTNSLNYWAFNTSSGTGLTYSWDFGDGSGLISAASPIHLYAVAGTYLVCLSVTSGTCTDVLCQNVVVSATTDPCLALFNIAADTTSTNPNAYVVTNLSYGTSLTYHWDFGDTTTSSLQLPSYIYAGTGPYLLCLTVDNGTGCTQTFCDSVFINDTALLNLHPLTINVVDAPVFGTSVAVNQLMWENEDWTLSPNPATNELTVNSKKLKIKEIKMVNVLGEELFQSRIANQKSTIHIDVSNLPKGIYFIQIMDENNSIATKKVIIQ